MVHKTQTKRKRDIKTKLMAAICMLLVSSIMMVSTTYAWFTLSTAPEVTGISTAVGANGNLEMALLPEDGLTQGAGNNYGITSQSGDSGKAANLRNITWGNLVDVSNNTFYGLNKITLNPAALNETAGILADAMLKTPSYGADGRVSELLENTLTSTFDGENFPQNNKYGVRAVGTASGMTDRQLAYRNARSTANTNMALAKSTSSTSLNTNGAALANIAVAHAANPTATHSQTDVTNLLAIVNDLLGVEEGKTGVLQYIEDAYRGYIVAFGASKAGQTAGMDDTKFIAFKGVVESAATLTEALAELNTYNITLPTELTTAISKLATTRANVESAKTTLVALKESGSDAITWNELYVALSKLADTDSMEINGYAAKDFKNHISAIVSEVASKGLTVTIAPGGGVYADVADHCGNFNAAINIAEVEYNGVVLENMPARMETAATGTPYLTAIGAGVETADAPVSGEGGQVMPISDFYGYIIDLAFRTNAAESNLLLQTEAADRIYDDNGADADTMGHGSTMTFTSTTTDFTVDQLKSLMSAIRVVFYNPIDSKILTTAKLDLTDGAYEVTGGNTITAKLYLYEQVAASTTYSEATDAQKTDETTKLYTKDEGADTYTEVANKTNLDENTTYYVQVVTAAGEQKLTSNDAVITALTQNVAQTVSALVYLDGEHITNADVAATAPTSMTGTMNLQFASSANLVPMEYTPLIVENGATTPAASAGNG